MFDDDFDESYSICPVCGDPIDYCQGHGTIGDPKGAQIMECHVEDEHSQCHPNSGCRQ